MSYAASKILWSVAEPGALLLLVCVAGGAMLYLRPQSRLARVLVLAGVAALAASAWLPIGIWLMRPLEDRFPPLRPVPARVDGIIVLGGAIDLNESTERGEPSLNARAGRMTAFVSLALRHPEARLVFSGGNPDLFAKGLSEAEVARAWFRELGLDPRRVTFEAESRNTRENALFSKRLVKPGSHETWLLVTSAADMPRAIGCFRAVAWPVIAFPTDYHTSPGGIGADPGLIKGLEDADWATHEWVGLLYYRMRGWIPSLFPAPHA